MSHERWAPFSDDDRYLISAAGDVWSLGRKRLLKPRATPGGYLQVNISGRNRYIHRLVLEAFVGPCPPGDECCHNNGDRADNRLENLRWGSRSANVRDAIGHGTHSCTRRTHCPRGHELNELNNVASKARRGLRDCLACSRARSDARNRRCRGELIVDPYATADTYYALIMTDN